MTTGYRYAMQQWVSNGVRVNYDFSFDGGYLHSADVKAYREPWNGTAVTGPREDLAVTFVVDNGANNATATVRVGATPAVPQPNGWRITVYRETEKGVPLVDFENGAVLTDDNLDLLTKQAIFATGEIADQFANLDDNSQATLAAMDTRITTATNTANTANTTANNASAAATTAQATANGAVTTANSALATANSTAAQLTDAITAANNATTAANNATAALDGIQGEVDAAVANANAAVTTANAASANANALSGQITTANNNATNALNTANAIDAKAQQALDNSAAAVTTANAAQSAVATVQADYMPKAGGGFTGGVGFGNNLAASAQDLTKHIQLYSSAIGFCVTASNLNYNIGAGGNHSFYSGSTLLLQCSSTVLTWKGETVWRSGNFDPSTKADLASPQFSGGIGLGAAPGGYSVNIAGSFAGNARIARIINTSTATDSTAQWSTQANTTVGVIQAFSTTYTGVASLAGRVELSSNTHIDYGAVSAGGTHRWTTGTGRTERMNLTNAGQLNVVSGMVTASGGFQPGSSRKVKHAMRPVRNALKTIDALELVTGKYRKDFAGDAAKHRRYFAVAEQAMEVAPELVTPDVFDYKGEKVPSFDYNGLAVLAAAGVQELLRIIQQQQEQINELKEMLE